MKPEEIQSIKDGIAYAKVKKKYYESLITQYQSKCAHTDYKSIPLANTGNYEQSYDSYWIEFECHVCGLKKSFDKDDAGYKQYFPK